MNGPAILAKLWEMGRKQEAAQTGTAQPVTLFQVARFQIGSLPSGVVFDFDKCESDFVIECDTEEQELDAWIAAARAEFQPEYEGDIFTLSDFDLFEAGATGSDGYSCVVRTWETIAVYGTVGEAVAHGEACAYRYRAAGRGPGIMGRDWRTYTVCAKGLLGDIVSAGIKSAIEEAERAD